MEFSNVVVAIDVWPLSWFLFRSSFFIKVFMLIMLKHCVIVFEISFDNFRCVTRPFIYALAISGTISLAIMMPFRVFLILGVLYDVINVKFSIGQDCFKEGGYPLKMLPSSYFSRFWALAFSCPPSWGWMILHGVRLSLKKVLFQMQIKSHECTLTQLTFGNVMPNNSPWAGD